VLAEDDNVALAAVSVAKLQCGAEMAAQAHHPQFVEGILPLVPVEDYTAFARLLARVRRAG